MNITVEGRRLPRRVPPTKIKILDIEPVEGEHEHQWSPLASVVVFVDGSQLDLRLCRDHDARNGYYDALLGFPPDFPTALRRVVRRKIDYCLDRGFKKVGVAQ